jgi:hypothetical protein
LLLLPLAGASQTSKSFTPYSDAQPILDVVRAEVAPADLRDRTSSEREAAWPEWIRRHDAAIRARVAEGEADSIVHLLLFGTSFTGAPRASEPELATLVTSPDEALRMLRRRIDDFAAAIAAPGANERLRVARAVVERQGIDPTTDAGRTALRRYLDARTRLVGGSVQSARALDPSNDLADTLTLFRERGLSSDTSIFIDYGVEQALDAMKTARAVRAGTIRRVAIVGPGLDFSDKLDGYDFYPEQTIQPFALIDSLLRLDLAEPDRLEVVAFDVGARVLLHLEAARTRARTGLPYTVVLPRNSDRSWRPELVEYWGRLGNWIGEPAPRAPAAPPNAGRVDVRAVAIRPSAVMNVTAVDLNIVTERLAVEQAPFDLVVATNVLLYYDVFDQSLAAANIADMLRAGGFLLTNNRIVELPGGPLTAVGHTDAGYMALAGIGQTGDRLTWYRRPLR